MKHERELEFRCDKCRANLTNKKHLRIFMGFTSGWMAAPYIGGKPVAELCGRQCEFHFCRAQCFALFFSKRINEIRPHTARHAERDRVQSALKDVLAQASLEGSRMPGTDHVGTRDDSRIEEGERDMGNRSPVRIRTFGGSVSGLRNLGQEDKPVDSSQSDNGLGRGAEEISSNRLGTKIQVPDFLVRGYENAKALAWSVMP